jgi:hypothetical protein
LSAHFSFAVCVAAQAAFSMNRSTLALLIQYVHLLDILTAAPIGSVPLCIPIRMNCGETPSSLAASLTLILPDSLLIAVTFLQM